MSHTDLSVKPPTFLSHFAEMDDPRQEAKIVYPLEAIFLLALCAVISGAQGWVSIALYGQKKLDLLRAQSLRLGAKSLQGVSATHHG